MTGSIENILEEVKTFAGKAHGAQTRKYSSDPYIVHPMRVMATCRTYTEDVCVLTAAILHDVLEDTPVTAKELKDFLGKHLSDEKVERTCQIVEELTDIFTRENFPRLNRRTRKQNEANRLSRVSGDAQTIKYADILDNTDVTAHDPDFALTYLREARDMIAAMKNGNPDLRMRVIQRVEDCIRSLVSEV